MAAVETLGKNWAAKAEELVLAQVKVPAMELELSIHFQYLISYWCFTIKVLILEVASR